MQDGDKEVWARTLFDDGTICGWPDHRWRPKPRPRTFGTGHQRATACPRPSLHKMSGTYQGSYSVLVPTIVLLKIGKPRSGRVRAGFMSSDGGVPSDAISVSQSDNRPSRDDVLNQARSRQALRQAARKESVPSRQIAPNTD